MKSLVIDFSRQNRQSEVENGIRRVWEKTTAYVAF